MFGFANARSPILLSRALAYLCLFCLSILELVVSSTVLGYSLVVYRGNYIKSNPHLIIVSGLTILVTLICFAFANLRTRVVLWTEMTLVFLFAVAWFVALIRLHIATPDLLYNCGGFPICKGWISMLIFAWLSWGSLCWAMTTLSIGAFHARFRKSDKAVWFQYAGIYWRNANEPTSQKPVRINPLTISSAGSDAIENKHKFEVDNHSQFTIS